MRGRFFYVPVELATTPASGDCTVMRFWCVHPEKGVAFYRWGGTRKGDQYPAPQCNSSEHVADHLRNKLLPDHEIKFLEVVFMSHADDALIHDIRAERKEKERVA